MMRTKTFTSLTCSLVLLLFGAVSYAAPLNGHSAAYNGWSGVSAYNDGDQLYGTIEWAVFKAADFTNPVNGLSPLGYVPDDALVYTYQIFNEGDAFLTTKILGVVNPASNIGQFNIGQVPSSSMVLDTDGGFALWNFDDPAIATGMTSWGLAISSPNKPIMGAALVIDDGSNAFLELPTPGPDAIPEPSGLLLLSISGGLVMFLRWRWG